MTRRALLIRSDYDRVAGAHNSAECMGQVLSARGFELTWCVGPDATRHGILAAYDHLIEQAQPDDAIAIYYAGHGGLATDSRYTPGAALPPHVQHLCPIDFAETRDDDFRGVCALELSLMLAALTKKTANTTVILECCFAAQMSRSSDGEPGAAPVIRPTLTRVGLTRHLEAVRARARQLGVVPGTASPHAVRVAASGQTELARRVSLPGNEALGALGIVSSRHDAWIGALTLGLVQILAEIGEARVPWRSIAPALRRRLLVQRPEIEGPISRLPFSLETVDHPAVAVRIHGDGVAIDAGEFLGVCVGDTYRVVPAGASEADPTAVVATFTIDKVWGAQAHASHLVWVNGHRRFPAHPTAIASSLAIAKDPVRIVAPDRARREILDALRASPRLRAAIPADDDVIGELRVTGDVLELCDEQGPLFPPARFPERLGDAVHDLANLSTERWLRGLPEDGGIATGAVTLALGPLGPAGAFRPMAHHGEPLGLGDAFVMRLENTTDAPLYANVFSIGLQRRIRLLSDAWTSGVLLRPNEPVYVGDTVGGELRAFGLSWPEGLPADQPRRDTVLAIVMTEPADLRALERDSRLGPRTSALPAVPELHGLVTRGISRGGSKPARHAILWRDYLLYPLDGSLDLGIPEIDANPPPAAGAPSTAPAPLQVRCDAIERYRDAARIDVLVVARSTDAPVRAHTDLPGEPMDPVVWQGEIRGAVDVYVFTSMLATDRRPLAELLRAHTPGDALAVLRAPGDLRIDLAPGASRRVAAAARRALARADPGVATAFRGSLGTDDVGAVRYRASAMGFTLSVRAG